MSLSRRRVVLTGGPGAGKTAVLELIRASFCVHVKILPEAAGVIFGGGFPRAAGVGRRGGSSNAPEYGEVPMAKLETVVSDELASWVVDTIKRAAFTGRAGDGKIFVVRVEQAVQIRSGEEGPHVL